MFHRGAAVLVKTMRYVPPNLHARRDSYPILTAIYLSIRLFFISLMFER
jgi:hypothetical protein